MSSIFKLRNTSTVAGEWAGQDFAIDEIYSVSNEELDYFRNDEDVFAAVASGALRVESETSVYDNPIEGWNYFAGDALPKSSLGNKLAIHSSSKPALPGKEFFLVWTGAGDDLTTTPPGVGAGDLLQFEMTPGTAMVTKDIHFAPEFGDIYIHEGYVKWEGGGMADHLCGDVIASPSVFQTAANLDLIIADNFIKYSPGGPGTGTHGFATTPVILPRPNTNDGDWDYNPVDGLLPNFAGTGGYKISDIERGVHSYINKIPTLGSSYGFTQLTSDETAYLPPGYFIRITVHNKSDTAWNACVFMEIFREQTSAS